LGAGLAAPALAQQANSTEMEREISQSTRHNVSAFRTRTGRTTSRRRRAA
jgi:hypothetical protein